MRSIVLLLLLGFAVPTFAQDSNGASAQSACAHWWKLRLDHRKNEFKGDPQDMYQAGVCFGYFQGLIEGMDGAGFGDGTTMYVFHIKRDSINSVGDVVTAFYTYLQQNPLAKGKPAWKILQTVLIDNHLAGFEKVSGLTQSAERNVQ